MIIQFKKLNNNAQLPIYSTSEAAGADVYATEQVIIEPNTHALIKTGLGCSIPEGWELQVRPRSGLALKNSITVLNSPGTIDADYTGELGVILINHGNNPFVVNIGDRIAQIVCQPVYQAHFEWVDETKSTDRLGGFGSTGV